MALTWPVIDFILDENKRRPIEGDVLFIGKQNTAGRDLGCHPGTSIKCLDQSAYEGAEIIWDMGYPVPDNLDGKFDFIYNGGCLDNMFNPGVGMMNLGRMLKVGGRLVCFEAACSFSWSYVMFSPGWFNDYFEANKFKSWKVYVCRFTNTHEMVYGPWEVYRYFPTLNPNGPAPFQIPGNGWVIITIAEKGKETTWDVQPMQAQYRNPPSKVKAA